MASLFSARNWDRSNALEIENKYCNPSSRFPLEEVNATSAGKT
jgi:hypothetical protein